ncbi:MAG TPA: hypothetical protein VKG80_05820 [Trebonia sp.]|nr:hypothetical protein [Trebonia sp.]
MTATVALRRTIDSEFTKIRTVRSTYGSMVMRHRRLRTGPDRPPERHA